MKRYFVYLLIALTFGCQSNSTDDSNLKGKNETDAEGEVHAAPRYTVPVTKAKDDVQRYANLMKQYDSVLTIANQPLLLNSPLQSFTIRSIDLIEALGMKVKYKNDAKYEYIRVYIGLDETSNFKLFLTPVEGADLDANPPKAGKDHILHGETKDANGNIIADAGYVMDFAKPCPNTCPELTLSH